MKRSQWYCDTVIFLSHRQRRQRLEYNIWAHRSCCVVVMNLRWNEQNFVVLAMAMAVVWHEARIHRIIYSLKYAIHSQIATNDHFGRNAFEMLTQRENPSRSTTTMATTTTAAKMMNGCERGLWLQFAMSQRWKQLKAKFSSEMMKNTLHVRAEYTYATHAPAWNCNRMRKHFY